MLTLAIKATFTELLVLLDVTDATGAPDAAEAPKVVEAALPPPSKTVNTTGTALLLVVTAVVTVVAELAAPPALAGCNKSGEAKDVTGALEAEDTLVGPSAPPRDDAEPEGVDATGEATISRAMMVALV